MRDTKQVLIVSTHAHGARDSGADGTPDRRRGSRTPSDRVARAPWTSMARAPRSLAVLAVLALAAGCAPGVSDQTDPSEDSTATASQSLQLIDMWSQVAVADDGSTASKATGALEVPFLDAAHNPTTNGGHRVRGTCGVTFISPHYAITASHCLSNANAPDPSTRTFTVRTFDVTAVAPGAFFGDSNLTGFFPNYTGTPMSTVPGYQSTAFTCHVVSRCPHQDSTYANSADDFNCGLSTGEVDVTMLYCGDRASNAPWLPVATTDTPDGPVEMYWFHEIINAPITYASAWDASSQDLFTHYTQLSTSNEPNNWHYLDTPTNVLIPLKSVPWSGGVARTRIGSSGWTDLFGCHGTSGSGVLQRNASGNLELLGPVHAGYTWANGNLCNVPTASARQASLSYASNSYVQQLQTKFHLVLMWDRYPINIGPIGPIGLSAAE